MVDVVDNTVDEATAFPTDHPPSHICAACLKAGYANNHTAQKAKKSIPPGQEPPAGDKLQGLRLKLERQKIVRSLGLEGTPLMNEIDSALDRGNESGPQVIPEIPRNVMDLFEANAERYRAKQQEETKQKELYIAVDNTETNGRLWDDDSTRKKRSVGRQRPTAIASVRCGRAIMNSHSRCVTIKIDHAVLADYDISAAKFRFVTSIPKGLEYSKRGRNYTMRLTERSRAPGEPSQSMVDYSAVFSVHVGSSSTENNNAQNEENNINNRNVLNDIINNNDVNNLYHLWQADHINGLGSRVSKVEHSLLLECIDCDDDLSDQLHQLHTKLHGNKKKHLQKQQQQQLHSLTKHSGNSVIDQRHRVSWFPLVVAGVDRPSLSLTIARRRLPPYGPGSSRPKREMIPPCVDHCCKVDQYISFEALNLSALIQFPKGYWTANCIGKCKFIRETPVSSMMALSNPTIPPNFRQTRANEPSRGEVAEEDKIYPCCRANEISDLSLLYYVNGTFIHGYVPIVVESCIC